MSQSHQAVFDRLKQHVHETTLLNGVESLLGWDERTKLPAGAGEFRAEQIRLLTGMIHRRRTEPQVGQWLEQLIESPLAEDAHSDDGATIRRLKRDYDKQVKLPPSLVEELAHVSVMGQQTWVQAKKNNDFQSFAPLLKRIIELKQQQAEALGYDDCAYDALLDDFEPGASTANVASILRGLREQLVPLIAEIAASSHKPDSEIVTRQYPVEIQQMFGRQAAENIGFDFQRGRLDVTDHPFCTEIGPHDCRITTRYDEHHFPGAFFGILHEAGHGIYEQGLRPDQFGLPPGTATSLGIHESQSRLWENWIGRSRPFWERWYAGAQEAFAQSLGDVSLDEFYFAINEVRPSLIRVEADEATYNLHIIIRFELEQSLIHGELSVDDLPSAWNDKYEQYLAIKPSDDADGVLQDVHWSAALFGYFPTYSLGNLYAGQFYEAAQRELGDLDAQFRQGEFSPLREWLRENIHRRGQCYAASDLVQLVTGQPLSHAALMRHLRSKYATLYGCAPA